MKKYLAVLALCVSLFFGGGNMVQGQQDTLPEELQGVQRGFTYGGNVNQSIELYEQQEQFAQDTARTVSLPWMITAYRGLIDDIKSLYPDYFDYVVLFAVLLFAVCQSIMARTLGHQNSWLSLFWVLAAGFISMELVMGLDVVALPLLVGLCAIPPLWQLFRIANVSFLKNIAACIGIVLVVYIALLTGFYQIVGPLNTIWSIFIVIVAINLLSNIAFHCGRTSWLVFSAIIPVIGPIFFMTACVLSLLRKKRINPMFVNLIMDMLDKDLSKIAIRQKALSAKVRLGYFEFHYAYAIQRFKDNKKAMIGWLYNIRFTIWNIVFVSVLALLLGQCTLTGLTLFGYYEEYRIESRNDDFYRSIREDNAALLNKVIERGESLYPECLPESIEMCDPVYSAVFYDSARVLEVLIAKGARTNAVDEKGWDPLEYANRRNKGARIIEMLEESSR